MLELLQLSENRYEVLDADGWHLFEGTKPECDRYIQAYESEVDWDFNVD